MDLLLKALFRLFTEENKDFVKATAEKFKVSMEEAQARINLLDETPFMQTNHVCMHCKISMSEAFLAMPSCESEKYIKYIRWMEKAKEDARLTELFDLSTGKQLTYMLTKKRRVDDDEREDFRAATKEYFDFCRDLYKERSGDEFARIEEALFEIQNHTHE